MKRETSKWSILINKYIEEPYRLFFPLGVALLLWGALIWIPLIWTDDVYPVLAHRYLMLNGFLASFITGFLMTAVPKFSQTWPARSYEVLPQVIIILLGIYFAYNDNVALVFLFSSLIPLFILFFMLQRIPKRKANPPYSFVFIFVGLILWIISGMLGIFVDEDAYKALHYEGAIASIILGVGSRLIPGILGHVEIVQTQRSLYERPVSIFKTIPAHFILLIFGFIGSYFLSENLGNIIRAIVVLIIGVFYWRLYQLPKIKTSLTRCIWFSAWMIVISFVAKVLWIDGAIHLSHSFFINGIVLLSLLISTRVLQSHGPKLPELENKKLLYIVTAFIFIAAATRVSAFVLPDMYLSHLAYSAIMLVAGVVIWGQQYLRYVNAK